MIEYVLYAVLGLLLLNVIAALTASIRRASSDNWLLAILLASTSSAAIIAVLAVLADSPRMIDVALVFTATAAVTAAVSLTARHKRIRPDVSDS